MEDENIVLGAKIFAILFPILIFRIMRIQLVMGYLAVKLIWSGLICECKMLSVGVLLLWFSGSQTGRLTDFWCFAATQLEAYSSY